MRLAGNGSADTNHRRRLIACDRTAGVDINRPVMASRNHGLAHNQIHHHSHGAKPGLAAGSYTGNLIVTNTDGTANNFSVQDSSETDSDRHHPRGSIHHHSTSQPDYYLRYTASFSVAASGTAPLTYQWRLNGTAIGGLCSTIIR